MDSLDTVIALIDWLALPITYLILIILFFIFIVRPFFAHLFNIERISAVKAVQKAEKNVPEMPSADEEFDEETDDFIDSVSVTTDHQTLSKLAESDPEKAGSLVKQWLKKDD